MLREKQLARVLRLHKLYQEGAIPTLAQHEVNPGLERGSRANYLYFTLPPSINFQRQSPAMWSAALKTWNDQETNYLFFPEKVAQTERVKVQKDLLKHKLALQRNKHTDIWIAVSKAFSQHFRSDPRVFFKNTNWDVVNILQVIQHDMRKDFPYISGPKMANYWIYILSQYTNAKFKNMKEISIIPDTHVLQCSVKLRIAKQDTTPIEVAALWKNLLYGSAVSPVEMHPVLWNWSRNNFKPEI
jgi:hypothetical protein